MELLTHRYRTLTILALVIAGQLLLLGYQVRTQGDVRLVRVWAVTAVTPVARLLETARRDVSTALDTYVFLAGAQKENRLLKRQLGELKFEVRRLRRELARADRAEALKLFIERSPSKMVAARVIGAGTGADSKVVFIDRGTRDGVKKGMAVVTPEGIAGRVAAAYPTASRVVLVTDPSFAAGVVSARTHVQGTLKGMGGRACRVDYVQNEQHVEEGEWFYTSGDDRVFPRGLPVGPVKVSREGKLLREILVEPAGLQAGMEEVLVILEGVHQPVPAPAADEPEFELLPPPDTLTTMAEPGAARPTPVLTDADRLLETYRRIGQAQGHVYGEGRPGSPPPDFNWEPGPAPRKRSPSGGGHE